MIDIKLLRENPSLFYDSCKARGFDTKILDQFFELDEKWRENLKTINQVKHEKNNMSLEVSMAIKESRDPSQIKEKVRELNSKLTLIEGEQKEIEDSRTRIAKLIPNLLDKEAPHCLTEEEAVLVRTWGRAKVFQDDVETFKKASKGMDYELLMNRPASHVDLVQDMGIVDLERAAKTSGARFYYMKNRLVKLELALVNYALDFLSERGFELVEPPFMLNYRAMEGATDVETFKDTLYKIEGEDLYLISTAEHPLAAFFQDEILEESNLPVRMAGMSPCFRKEAGSHGKDTKGIFRVHQFTKIEQFIYCRPEDSWDFFDELVKNSEDMFRNLELPYRVVNICSGDLGNLAARKFDIEAWFPSQGKFREVVSASNDTDYQARSLNIRYRAKGGNRFVHTLNSTAVATTRALVAIMENNQLKDQTGFQIPKALIPYTGFETIIK